MGGVHSSPAVYCGFSPALHIPSFAKHVQLWSEVVFTAEPGQHASHGQSAGLSPLKCSHCGHSLWQIVTFGSSLGPAAAAAAAQSPSARTRIAIDGGSGPRW